MRYTRAHIYRPKPQGLIARLKRLGFKRWAVISVGALLLLLLVNGLLFVMYKDRTYPKTFIGNHRLGSVTQEAFGQKLSSLPLLPDTVELTYRQTSAKLKPSELGMSVDTKTLKDSLLEGRSWIPLADFLTKRTIPISLSVDDQKFAEGYEVIKKTFVKEPVNAKVILQNNQFAVQKETDGLKVAAAALKRELLYRLGAGEISIKLPATIQFAEKVQEDLLPVAEKLRAQQESIIELHYQGKRRQLTSAEIASLFSPVGDIFEMNDDKIRAMVVHIGTGFGIRIKNLAEATAAVKEYLGQPKTLSFGLVAAPSAAKTYAYCTNVRGVDTSYLPELRAKLAAVYNSAQGWSLDGLIAFSPADSGCSFTVWLSAASQMSSFGGICDAEWSCMPGNNQVVINFDRWQGASTAWNAAGGSLDDYRSMVINHETGHWLGFGHANCPPGGGPAPVMQQQSIDLQGCTFNPWPSASERASLKTKLGI